MRLKLAVGLGALVLLSCLGAHAAPPPNISQTVGVCDPYYPTRCAKPAADGSTPVTLPPTASITATPLVVVTTDKSGTISSGGAAQTAIALNASRKGWCIQDLSTAIESLFIRVNGVASPTTGVEIMPGKQACNAPGLVDPAAVSIYAATTGHVYTAQEVQ